ncbi:cysteine-rich receptor-like protein kinase 29 [Gastrolobium bilobum]|uniref:cysteine-rich receptor-like protein kinase 29 n=1 Tax=Gastrolobium bilobum TaxID=150636 RepID=UPI002AB03D3B|nr:cysteine-rich receptor-like protein kinase 29 [Gastrolobium bilobum]
MEGNYTPNSTYHTNLNTLLSTLTSNTEIDYGFYNFSYGQNSNKVNVIGLCRGDVRPDECRSCLDDSRVNLTQLCPNQKEAIVWFDICMLRYSNRSIFGIMETSPFFNLWNGYTATEVDKLNQVLGNLMRNLKDRAASGDSRRKYAAANATFQNLYGVVQCTPDLSRLDCNDCLDEVISEFPTLFDGQLGGRVVRPSCNGVRYETYGFYEPTPISDTDVPPPTPLSSPSTNNTSSQGKGNMSRTAIAIVVPTVVAVFVLLFFICIYLRRKAKKDVAVIQSMRNSVTTWKKQREKGKSIATVFCFHKFYLLMFYFDSTDDNIALLSHSKNSLVQIRSTCEIEEVEDDYNEIKIAESLQFDFDTIRVATSDFSDSNKLGQCGFGAVYLGRLSNGQVIAVKRLSRDSGQGDTEFKNEVLLLAKLQHRNLVSLLGFCLEGRERLLVYEFVPNKSLDLESVRRNWREGTATNIVDPSLNNSSGNEMMRRIHIGLLCVQENLADRPTMAAVALMLNSDSLTLQVPSEPAFYMDSRTRSLPHMQSWP